MSLKLINAERFEGKPNYGIYCVNIFGTGLKSIRDEFKHQVLKGLRQNVFLIDLEDITNELRNQPRNTKMKNDLIKNFNAHLINLIMQQIKEFLRDYEKQIKQISEELKFDLYQYWLKPNEKTKKTNSDKTKNNKKSSKETKTTEEVQKDDRVACTSTLVVKEHNRVGQSALLSQRKYIRDEPVLGKVYIIILGNMSNAFYTDLLSRDQPLEGVINFMPRESNYDVMLGNNKLRNFIASTLETINHSINNLRKEVILKPVGLFTHELPVISNCLATKHSREIFDQLTWSIYDIDMLRLQYDQYYFKPFHLTDVEIPANENITELYHVAESLSVQGQFQKSTLTTSDADLASIVGYLNSLLNTCFLREEEITENRQANLTDKLPNSFSTITNISQLNRLVVAENNKLLVNMLRHVDLEEFNSIYLCCLDYDVFGRFAISKQPASSSQSGNSETEDLLNLPRYVKYYANNECSSQRITELQQEYDEYEIRDISDGYKLYIFRRNFNVLKENEDSVILPTRLCFRDFTLFQKEEFLKDLQTPELNSIKNMQETSQSYDLDPNIFTRPHSIKAVLLQKHLTEQSSNQKSEARSSRRKSEKNSSVPKTASLNEAEQGLPPDHRLLQGYNLDDTLQQLKFKTSTYNFRQGFIKLNEEKWCFQVMNKQISLSINNITLFLSKPRYQQKGISNNIRLVTEDNLSLRILNDPQECSKVVMNYPNGLSIFHHESDCEQIWYCDQTPRDEQRRICTSYGAIIVFFKSQDIKIIRYNGEVYSLRQCEQSEEEEQDNATYVADIEKTKQSFRKKRLSNTKKSNCTQKLSSEESLGNSSDSNSTGHNLTSCLSFELKFINSLCSRYGLTYLRLKITTSQGKIFNVTSKGKISEEHHCSINEWFDYFANEAYCERSDGVKMIWTQNSFKCFHKDGTVFTTTVAEDLVESAEDEFDSQISQSSSHKEFLEQTEENRSEQSSFGKLTSNYDLITANSAEEYKPHDIQFEQYKCKSFLMQHPNYAEVLIRIQSSSLANLEIFGINDLRIFTEKEDNDEKCIEMLDFSKSGYEGFVEDKANVKLTVNVWFAKNLKVKFHDVNCKIYAEMPNAKIEKNDSLCLSLKYTDCISAAFKYLCQEIDKFENNNNECAVGKLYFMEKLNTDASVRGFEFFPSLSLTSNYKYQISNYTIELKGVNTINDSVLDNRKEHENDFNKFPRFKQTPKEKTCQKSEDELPQSLSVNVFFEIPKQLRTLMNVTKFLEPFENICFKRLRGIFKNVLNYYLKPEEELWLQVLCSKISWKNRLHEHKKRIFSEKQRLGLYTAMLKHETYPNYWKFSQTYNSDVKCIEFFDFMQNQCKCNSNQQDSKNN